MGMQISRGIHPEVPQEKYLWVGETGIRADHSGFSSAERERSGGGAPDGRPCSHAVVDTAEVLGLRGGGFIKGKSAIAIVTKVHGSGEELCGTELLGEGLLRVNGGAG